MLKARDFRGCWEKLIVIHDDLKCSSYQTAQTIASCRQTNVHLCVCTLVCLSAFRAGTRGGNYFR